MNILGIDPSLSSSGYCVIRKGGSISAGTIPVKKAKGNERLGYIRDKFKQIILKHKIDIIFIEGYSFGSQGRSFLSLAELGGVIRLLFYEMNIPYYQIYPLAVKKFITGVGNAEKEELVKVIKKDFNISFTGNKRSILDKTDAFAIAYFGKCVMAKDIEKLKLPLWRKTSIINYKKKYLNEDNKNKVKRQ